MITALTGLISAGFTNRKVFSGLILFPLIEPVLTLTVSIKIEEDAFTSVLISSLTCICGFL